MLQFEYHQSRAPLVVATVVALICHALFLVFALPVVLRVEPSDYKKREPKPQEQEMRIVVRSVTPEEIPEKIEVPLDMKEFFSQTDDVPEKQKPPEEDLEKLEEIEIDIEKKTVEQVTNEERPEEAKFLSSQDNKTEKETRAKETTLKEVLPSNEKTAEQEDTGSPDPDVERSDRDEDPAEQSQALAMAVKQRSTSENQNSSESSQKEAEKAPDETKQNLDKSEDGVKKYEEDSSKTPVVKNNDSDGPPSKVDPKRLFGPPSLTDYERVYGDESPKPKSDGSGKERRRLFSNYAEKQRALKGSLENMIPEIQPGNHTSVNAHRSVYAGYIGALHRRIHARWANQFLVTVDTQYPRSHPLQNPNLETVLEFVIDARSGKFETVTIVKGSGEMLFDAEAISVAWSIGPRPNPPPQIVSPNGKIYVHWTFYRDGRQCGVFGASIYLMTADSEGRIIREKTDMPK